MSYRSIKALLAITAISAFAVPGIAQAKNGADDPAGHVRHTSHVRHHAKKHVRHHARNGADDGVRQARRGTDDGVNHARQGTDDGVNNAPKGADDGPNHS